MSEEVSPPIGQVNAQFYTWNWQDLMLLLVNWKKDKRLVSVNNLVDEMSRLSDGGEADFRKSIERQLGGRKAHADRIWLTTSGLRHCGVEWMCGLVGLRCCNYVRHYVGTLGNLRRADVLANADLIQRMNRSFFENTLLPVNLERYLNRHATEWRILASRSGYEKMRHTDLASYYDLLDEAWVSWWRTRRVRPYHAFLGDGIVPLRTLANVHALGEEYVYRLVEDWIEQTIRYQDLVLEEHECID